MTKRPDNQKQRIITIALHLFSKQGYKGTTMRQIAKGAGMQAGSLYNHVKSKENLLLELQTVFLGDMSRRIVENPENLPARDRLEKACEEIMQTIAGNRLAWKVLIDEIHHFPLSMKKRVKMRGKLLEDAIKEILEEGKRNGEFRDFDTQMVANFLLGACHHSSKWIDPRGRFSAQEIGTQFASFLLQGLRKQQ